MFIDYLNSGMGTVIQKPYEIYEK